jgi:CheY-like chemotaxis protein
MNVFVVEDSEPTIAAIQSELELRGDIVTVARDRESARHQLLERVYDVLVLDLRIPPAARQEADERHGEAVVLQALADCPGTPTMCFSAHRTGTFTDEILKHQRQLDFFGTGITQPQVEPVDKTQFSRLFTSLEKIRQSVSEVDSIELIPLSFPDEMSSDDKRLIRLCTRRASGVRVRVAVLVGGLSGARVYRLAVEAGDGATVASLVLKTASVNRIENEIWKKDLLSGALEPGSMPESLTPVRAGCGRNGALVYQLAASWKPLFDLIPSAVQLRPIVERVKQMTEPGRAHAAQHVWNVHDVRALLVDDDRVVWPPELADIDRDEVEGKRISVRNAVQHGDLHPGNVMVNDQGRALLIDPRTVIAPSSLDPVTLELGLILHPDGHRLSEVWPGDSARDWSQLDQYLLNCPFPEFIEACRTWSHEAMGSVAEMTAVVFAYALRQVGFDNARRLLAVSLLRSASLSLLGRGSA